MKRKAFNTLALGSVPTGLAYIVLWISNIWWTYLIYFTVGPAFIQIGSFNGRISFEAATDCRPYSTWPHLMVRQAHNTLGQFSWQTLGFGFRFGHVTYFSIPMYRALFLIPVWYHILFPAIVLILWLRWQRRLKRDPMKTCMKCGYDLQGSIGKCPECGAVIPVKAAEDRGSHPVE